MYSFNKNKFLAWNFLPYLIMIVTMIIWGSTWPLGRWLVSGSYGSTIPQLIIVIARYIIVVPIFFLLLYAKEKSFHFKFAKENFKFLSFLGLVNVTIYQIGYLFGETYTSGTEASLLTSTSPLVVFLITLVFLHKPFSLKHIIGIIIGFLGVLLVIIFEAPIVIEGDNRLLGNVLILLAVLAYATYTVSLKEFIKKFSGDNEEKPSSLAIISWVSLIGTFFIIPIAFGFNPEYLSIQAFIDIPVRIWFGIIYLAIFSTIIGFLLYIEGIRLLDPNKAVIFVNIIPIVGILLSALFLGEKLNIFVHFGALILIFISIYLVNKK
jgi:drug/metabolite transporter (DMT)-like permease